MDDTVRIVIISLIVLIAAFAFYTSRRSKKFEAFYKTGIYKTKSVNRGLEALILLIFGAAALISMRNIISPMPGVIFMAVTFICWLPFQALMHTMLLLNDKGIVFMAPFSVTEIQWQDVTSVSVSLSAILIKSGDKSISVRPYFAGFSKIKEKIAERYPEADK